VLLLLLGASVALAEKLPEVVTREASGEAAIVGGNVDRAAREAKEAALREAVEQVAGVMISAQTLSANSQLISDQVFSHSAGYVRTYQVLSQTQDKGVVKVAVRAEVGTKELDRDLQAVQALVRRLAGRRLVILLQEQTIDDKGITLTSGVASTVLTDAFRRDGWTLVDPSFAAGKLHLASAVALGAVEAKEIGTLSRADVILYGTVAFRDTPVDAMLLSGGGQRAAFPLTGDYDFGVFETSTGSQLAKVSGKLRSSVQDMSIQSREESAHNLVRAHAEDIVTPVRKAVLESLRSAEQNGNRLVLELVGVGDFAALQAFTRELPKWSAGVRELASPTLAAGRGRLEVTYLGSAAALAEQLEGKGFRGKKLGVTGVSGNTLEVTLAR
jgi:Flagellar assembly protein T, N-terminal domain